MKTPSTIHALLLGASFLAAPCVKAATLYWDSNGSGASGSGDTPTGTWGTDVFWTTDSTGANVGSPVLTATTTSVDDLFFSAGSDAINAYIVSLNSATRSARLITFEDGTATLNTGTLSLGNGGGITVTSNSVLGATISTSLTLSGSQTFNVASSRTLTLNTGTFTRNAGSTLSIQGAGTVNTTMTGLDSTSLVNGIIGPWASFGTGASTRYATIDGSNNIVAYTGGTAAATAAGVTNTGGTFNYDVAAVGTLGPGANINTLRYTGGAGTIAGALTTNGIMNVGGGALTLSGLITSGTGGIVLNAANGNLIFPHTTGGLSIGSNPLTITGSSAVTFGTINQNNITLTGSGNLVKNGSGVFSLSGLNTGFTGNTTVNGGTLLVTAVGSIGSGNLTLNGGIYEEYWTNTFSRALGSGAGQVQLTGGASGFSENGSTGMTVNLGGAAATVVWGSAFFNPSTFVLQSAAAQTGSTINFQNGINLSGATRTIASYKTSNLTSGATISGIISNSTGTAGLIKEGEGLLVLSNSNTYNGSTTISAGILQANSTAAIGNSSATNTLIFDGGTLRAGGAITSAATRSVTMTQTGIIDTNSQAISIAGNIGGAGGLTKNGNGTLTLSGTNNYGGVTTVNTGTLAITKQAALASNTAANLNVKSNSTLSLNVDSAGSAGFSTSNLNTLLGNISVANTAAQGLQAGATLGLDTSTATGATFTPSTAITNSTGAFGGSIGLNKLGAGSLVLDQANTFTGNTTVNGGTLQLGSGTSTGSLSSSRQINIGSGATFAINQSDTITQGTDFSALITGAGSMANLGSGTLVLNAPTFHTGNTTATAGNITLNDASAIRFSALNTTGAGTVTLGTGVTSPTFGGLSNSGATRNLASVIDSSYANVTNLTLNPQSGSITYGGVIADGAAGMTLNKTGAGTQILQGANSYAGATNVRNGTLTLSGASGAIASTAINLNGGGLTMDNTTNSGTRISDSATITVNGSSSLTFSHAGATGVNYTETIDTLSLQSGSLTYTGSQANATGPRTSNLQFNTLSRSGMSTVNFTGTGLGTNGRNTIKFGAGVTDGVDLGPWAVVNGADFASYSTVNGIVATANTTLASSSNNSATNFRQSTNIASLDLSLNPSYKTLQVFDGATNIRSLGLNGNTVSVGGISSTGGSTVGHTISGTGAVQTLNAGDALYVHVNNFNLNVNSTIQNVAAGSTASALVKSGNGTLTLGGTNTYSGGTVINAGTLSYNNDSRLGLAGTRNITFGGTSTLTGYDGSSLGSLTVNSGAVGTVSANTITFATTTGSGIIRGTGGQNDTLALGNASTFTGDVALAYNANNNSGVGTPHVSFTNLSDTVGSALQIYRIGGGTDSGQIGQIGLVGNAGPLTFNNRQIQLLAKTGGSGSSMAQVILLNNSSGAQNTWAVNTDLLNNYDRDVNFTLAGTNAGNNAFAGAIGNAMGGSPLRLEKAGTGRWIVSGANTYTGTTTISGGTLEVTSLANGGSASSLGVSSNAASNLLLANATTLRYTGSGDSTDRRFTLNVSTANHGASIDASGTGAINFTNTASPSYGTTNQNRTLTLTGTNTGNNTLAANLANNGTGATTITKTGIGTWVLSGANVNTGATNISGGGNLTLDYGTQDNNKIAGVLTLNNGGGDITLRGGSHVEAVSSTSLTTGGGHTHISREVGSTAILSLGAITRSQSAGFTLSLAEDNLATTTSTVATGILGGGITVGSNWAKVSSGNIVALTAGDYTALTAAGTTSTLNYQLTGSLSRGSASVNSLRIAGNGDDQVLTITSGNLTPSIVGTGAGTFGNSGGILYAGGGNDNYTITGPGSIQAQNSNQELIIHAHTGTLTVDMALTMGLQGLTKSGAGTLALTKAGTYSGTTFVNQGALQLRNNTAAGTAAGGVFVANNAALELANGITVGAEALSIIGSGVSSGGALRNISGTNSYAGVVTIGNGGSRINSDSSGALTLSGGVVTSLFNNVTFGGAGNTTVSTTAISGAGGLVKDGLGTTILSATNTYSGATTVSNGILAINGTGSINSSAVTVNGGNFRYNSSTAYTGALTFTSGTISGTNWNGSLGNQTVATGDILSPGNSPGTATTTGQTWAAGGTYEWEINSTAGSAGLDPGWDLISGSGTLDITAIAGNEFTIDVMSLTTGNVAGAVFDFDETLNYNWMIANFDTINGFTEDAFIIDTTQFALHNTFTGTFDIVLGNTGSIGGTNNQVWLTYTAIPEPKAVLLGCLGVLLLLRRRR